MVWEVRVVWSVGRFGLGVILRKLPLESNDSTGGFQQSAVPFCMGLFLLAPLTLIQEYTLNHDMNHHIIQGLFLVYKLLETLGTTIIKPVHTRPSQIRSFLEGLRLRMSIPEMLHFTRRLQAR